MSRTVDTLGFAMLSDGQNSFVLPDAPSIWQNSFNTSFCHLLLLLAHPK